MNKFKAAVARLKQESQQRKVLKEIDYNWVVTQMDGLSECIYKYIGIMYNRIYV
ncbi:hypothetical protein [Plebeiibacterium sediminum]|uniref:Uncharacterized protein n=1 Tax=Plebeiibacterium sediminum TaxID=2992112 RepID=A0AAE3M9I4_9BACT|nr:hypothetical protein [Plebeiobacterium sediminum]MCW3789649.1 hypothetical protein [Plebeiobacterium sediminum]